MTFQRINSQGKRICRVCAAEANRRYRAKGALTL